jgi:hypothetical protein
LSVAGVAACLACASVAVALTPPTGSAALTATRGVLLSPLSAVSRAVERFGDVPSDVRLPDSLTWTAGVWLDGGAHQLATRGTDVRLSVDGIEINNGTFDVARGMHFVHLTGDVHASSDLIELTIDGQPVPADSRYRLMDAPWGLLGQIGSTGRPLVDATVAMAFFDPGLGFISIPTTITWSGWLVAPRTGLYRMAFAAEDHMRLELDGQTHDVTVVDPGGWATVGLGSVIQLGEGPHRVRVTLDVTHGGRDLARWNWVPPLPSGHLDTQADWSVVPPTQLRPDLPVRRL